jgi:HSP20 family protein
MNMPVPRRRRPAVRWRGGWPAEFWDPFGDFAQTWNRMAQVFEAAGEGGPDSWVPTVETDETDDAYVVRAELPGMKSEDVNVEQVGNELRVSGEVGQEDDGKALRHRQGKFAYRASLPSDADPGKIDAELTDGVLTVRVPKAPQAQARRIEVKS